MPITLSPAYIKKLLKQSPGTVVREANLYLEVGTGKKKVVHVRFYYKNPGRKYRKLGTLDAESTAQHCKTIYADYIEMYTNWNRGISPDLIDKQTEIERQHKEDELRRIDALKTVDEIWADYFEKHLEGKSSALTRHYSYGKHIKNQIGSRPADQIPRQTLLELIRNAGNHGYEAANTCSINLTCIGNYGFDSGFLSNHKEWEKLPQQPKVRRTRVATDRELARILKQGSPVVKASVFMGQRAWNHIKYEWEEIKDKWITIPPHKFKSGRHHQVFLTETVLDLFKEFNEQFDEGDKNFNSNWIFPGWHGKHISTTYCHRAWKAVEVDQVKRKSEPVTLQAKDLRRTCYTFIEQHHNQLIMVLSLVITKMLWAASMVSMNTRKKRNRRCLIGNSIY